MNKIRIVFFIAAVALLATADGLHAQISSQRLTISLFAQYQTNIFTTNTSGASPLTNQFSKIKDVLIATGNVIKAIAIDLEGTNWTTLAGAELAREVNLTNGSDGIFLRKGTNNINVSSFFPGFSNNFAAGLLTAFPAATNGIYGNATNVINGSTNNVSPTFDIVQGSILMTGPTNSVTNFTKSGAPFFISLNTTNIKFNLVGFGDGDIQNIAGRISGTLYERPVNSEVIGTAGTFYLNVTTNIFDIGTAGPVYVTGPLRGTVVIGTPNFSPITGP